MGRLGRLIKYLFWLALLGAVALSGYALVSDLPAPLEEVTVPLPVPDGGQ